MKNVIALLVGFLFSAGLAIAGMTQPQKIIGFLNPWDWDASLLFVMIGALAVHASCYPLVRRRASPILDVEWHVPNRRDITPRLLIGSAVFGIGWGLGGFCPGPGLASVFSGDERAVAFVGAMVAGMWLFRWTEKFLKI